MKIVILNEGASDSRVSASPETVKKINEMNHAVYVQKGAGIKSNFLDQDYEENGAKIFEDKNVIREADVIFKINKPSKDQIDLFKEDSILIAALDPFNNPDLIEDLRNKKIISFAMELMPRITRAQSMDVLSSQSNLAGYQAVINASKLFNKALPMMMTAAGTIAPAKVMVFGAGVAGLQAIATAKRLGAIVSATDVRAVAKEQVESLGGKFIMVESDELEDAETSGGYAKEMSAEFKTKQAELISRTLSGQDIVICTALIPGKKAPVLISENQVKSMKPGSIIIDLASESGGNCECSKSGEIININEVLVVGAKNITSEIAQDASSLFAKNLLNFFMILLDSETNEININWEDEIITGTALTKNGEIIHEGFNK
jgi:NAD(P) transhydrogenase subunit alpha